MLVNILCVNLTKLEKFVTMSYRWFHIRCESHFRPHVFIQKIMMLFKWWSSINIFNQIWQYSKYARRLSQAPFHIVGNRGDFLMTILFFHNKKTF
jgi:hypothetical protein